MISFKQSAIIVLVVLIGALLYFLPHHSDSKAERADHKTGQQVSLSEAAQNAPAEHRNIYERVMKSLSEAESANSEAAWKAAAEDLLKAARFIQDASKGVLYTEAIRAFEEALKINPDNLSVKTGLGTAMVETSTLTGSAPMQGIGVLREVLAKDSGFVEAHLQLGLFSLTSRQFDKAIERFSKVLMLDTSRIDMYVYLGDTYASMGNKDKAIENFEKYKSRISDTLIINNINSYIKNLKTQP